MKKIFKAITCLGLCGAMAFGIAGCNKSEHRDPEKDALRLAIGAVDQKFNPLFYTSQNDGEIANMTQVALVTSKADPGDLEHPYIAVGEDQPTVALDYKETYYNKSGDVIGSGDGKTVTGRGDQEGSTAYEFLIKNGMKFSDGEPLTVMDVLFNLYVYLDPVYSGSSTIYSTKIKGLQAYRTQKASAKDDEGLNLMDYYPAAQARIQRLKDWSDGKRNDVYVPTSPEDKTPEDADLKKVKELYKEELETDWNSVATGWVEGYKEYNFTSAWQVFYYIEGIINNQTEMNEYGTMVNKKDANGKYLTTLDPDENGDIEHQGLIREMEEATTPAKVQEFIKDNPGVSEEFALLELQKRKAIEHVYTANTARNRISYVLTYTATASTALDYFILDEMSNAAGVDKNNLQVPTISGITVRRDTKFNDKEYGEAHDILRIEINGIDPKAKWNFGVTVAPMHYYSDGKNGEYTKAAMQDYEDFKATGKTITHFGVKYRDIDWFSNVLSNGEKNGKPVGAGAYQCCNKDYKTDNVNSANFFYSNMAYFARNEYFTTMGAEIENAKIKYVTYKVYRDDKIVEALTTKEIDYGTPTATADNQRELNKGSLKQITYLAGGYGYVGINPKAVPDLEVRQAIMHAFDTSSIIEYYGENLVNMINRPMSTTSWAYPEGATRYYERWTDPKDIKNLIVDGIDKDGTKLPGAGGKWYYDESDGKLHSATGGVLKLTFIIAGESLDHPSYSMFVDAEVFLEQCGFEISVETDINALKKLTTGDLAVWAAAWSSSIDPDPYQIYSIDSNATSTKNWYKDGILQNQSKFEREYKIANQLNEKIKEGRNTLNQADREEIYGGEGGALDLIMQLAVEFPTYQRNDLCVYNSAVLEASSMHIADASFQMAPLGELWKVEFKK